MSTAENRLNGQNKMVNVHGVQFDISSILNDVTASIQNNIQKSLDGALKDYELYKSTHDAILQIPFVRDLYIQNQELASQLEMMMEQTEKSEQPEEHIQLKIDEITPPSSPVVMNSYVQLRSNDHDIKTENKKLSSDDTDVDEEESTTTNQSENSTESEAEKTESEAESSVAEEEAEEADASSSEEEEEEEEEEADASSSEQEEEEEEADASSSEEEEQEEEEEAEAEADAEEEEEEEADAEEEEEEEDAEEEEADASANEEEEEVYEIVIKNVTYFTTNEDNGNIYESIDGDVGEIVGKFKNQKPVFMRRK